MPNLTQDNDHSDEFGISKEPWQDRNDFMDPKPMRKPENKPTTKSDRFKECSEEEILKIQHNSKAASTHKQTKWGVKNLRGRLHI